MEFSFLGSTIEDTARIKLASDYAPKFLPPPLENLCDLWSCTLHRLKICVIYGLALSGPNKVVGQ